MSHVLVVAGALISPKDWDRLPADLLPQRWARRLMRAPRRVHTFAAPWSDGASHLAWLAQAFAVPGDPPACAAYAWRALAGPDSPAPTGQVWCCDPVHLSIEPERTVLTPIHAPPLTESEADALFAEAAAGTAEVGAQLLRAGGRWLLFAEPPWDLRTSLLPTVLGASIEARLPAGPQARTWRRLLNDVQMRWYAHPVNRAREARGQQVANGLWLHGGGFWQALPPSRFARVESDDPVVLGWQLAATLTPAPLPPAAGEGRSAVPTPLAHAQRGRGAAGEGDVLTVHTTLFDAYSRLDWRSWAEQVAQLDSLIAERPLELVLCGRRSSAHFALGALSSRLPWPRRSLRDCLTEAESS